MDIIRVLLYRFKPLALNDIESIDITNLTSDITLILGCNGSGKSSVLMESNVFPAHPKDYLLNGKKIYECAHRGSRYELISNLGKVAKYTFIKDGVAILEEVNATVQREMAIKEFGYTPVVHAILIGKLNFTDMTTTQRREMLTLISPLDLSYAYKLYGAVKDNIRDATGVMKHLTNKKIDYEAKIHALKVSDNIEEEKERLETKLDILAQFTTAKTPYPQPYIDAINKKYDELLSIQKKIEAADYTRILRDGVTNVDDLNHYIGELSAQIANCQIVIDKESAELFEIKSTTNMLEDGQLSIEDLVTRQAVILEELKDIDSKLTIDIENHEQAKQGFYLLRDQLTAIYNDLGSVHIFTPEEMADMLSEKSKLEVTSGDLTEKMRQLNLQIKHHEEDDTSATCPRCALQFKFTKVSTDDRCLMLKNTVRELHSRKVEIGETLAKLQEPLDHIRIINEAKERINVLRRNLRLPSAFWLQLENSQMVISNKVKTQGVLLKWITAVEYKEKQQMLTSELESINITIKLYEKFDGRVSERIHKTEQIIDAALKNKYRFEDQLTAAKSILKNFAKTTALSVEAELLINDINSLVQQTIDIAIAYDAKEKSNLLHDTLSEIRNVVANKSRLYNALDETNAEYNTVYEKHKHLLILEEQLSPTTGLIAEQMLGFIDNYLYRINLILDEIWGYRLELETCKIENGNLDYTFPLLVRDEIVGDISLGSTGQKDIINFAFMIVMRQFLKLEDYPMYMDETGAHFDELHKRNLMTFIQNYVNNQMCSRLFIVNHFANVHGSLSHHDTIVLRSNNITIPDVYNQAVKIEYR